MSRSGTESRLSRKVAGSTAVLGGRRVIVMTMSAVSTAVVARLLGVGSFGQLSSGLAAFWLASGLADFGFTLVLGRDLAQDPAGQGRLLRAVLQVQLAWALIPTAFLVVLAVASGPTSTRGLVMLVLAPAILVGGVTSSRQVFLNAYRAGRLASIDLATNAAQLGLTVLVAVLGAGPVGIAAVLSACSIANDLGVAAAALRLVDRARATAADRRSVLRRAMPLGVVSFMASVYFTVDLVLLGWLVSSEQLGSYAAACKILSLLVVIPGLLTSAALPAFSESVNNPEALRELASRVLHWLAVVGLPICVGTAVFARPLIRVGFGAAYGDAVPLLRILCLAAILTLVGNVLGTMLIARSSIRPLLLQNSAALVLNIAGNLVLAPIYGVTASAWLTVATELLVCAGALNALRGSFGFTSLLGVGARPAVAVAGLAATGIALSASPALGIPAAIAVFGLLLLTLGAWPVELRPHRLRFRRP